MRSKESICPACGARFLVRVDAEGLPLPAPSNDRVRPPFCSERCRALDFGMWLEESYRISEPLGEREHTEE